MNEKEQTRELTADKRLAYAARCKCGCGAIRAASLDDKGFEAETAEFVADLIRDGYAVERISVASCVLSMCKKRPRKVQSGRDIRAALAGVTKEAT